MCKLNGKGGEDEPEVSPVREISGAEERGPESSVGKQSLCDRVRDGGLSRSGQSIQPVDRGCVEVACPEFDFIQNGGTGFLKTAVAISMPIFNILCITIFEDGCEGDHVR